MDATRIVVTGMGLVSPVGNTVQESWDNIRNGRSGIDWIKVIDTSNIDVKIAGEVKNFDPEQLFDRRLAKRTDRAQQFALVAAKEALDHAGVVVTEDNMYDIGVLIGSGIGSIGTTIEAVRGFAEKGPRG